MGKAGDNQYIAGYHYLFGAHLVAGGGVVDEISKFRHGERIAWSGSCTGGPIYINAPNLHGGESREGGFVGTVNILTGLPTQGQNAYLVSQLGADVPAYRGEVGIILEKCRIATNNPYVKPVAVFGKRTDKLCDGTAQWYPAKANINGDMNPAHVVREAWTNQEWGKKISPALIDDAALTYAADVFYAENAGFALFWKGKNVEDLIREICRHFDTTWYQDMTTGLFKMVPIRDDYDPETLDVYGEDEIIAIENFTRPGWGESANEITVLYVDRDTNEQMPVTRRNIANIAQVGAVISEEKHYDGIGNAELAQKVVMRDLRQSVSNLARMDIIANRKLSKKRPGDVFKITWPPRGIDEMIVRVANIKFGVLTDGKVKLTVVEDVFGAPESIFSPPPPSGWVNPINEPQIPPYRNLDEAPYWTIVRQITGENGLGDYEDEAGVLITRARKPTPDAFNYDALLRESPTSDFLNVGAVPWTPTATLTAGVGLTETTWSITGAVDLDQVEIGRYAAIGPELVAVTAKDIGAGQVTVDRGVLDTVPALHSAGDRIWFCEQRQGVIAREHLSGEDIDAKFLTRTSKGVLDEAVAPINSLTFNHRAIRPYPPGKVRINTEAYPDEISGELTVEWAHRDRQQQTAYLVTQDEGNIGPEPGTTYTLRIYGDSGVLKRTETGLAGTSYTYLEADEKADNGGNWNAELRIELEAVRDSYTSRQCHDISFTRS
jgi:hypothetical protein